MASSIGLGCMRLSTDADRDEARALATLRAALDAGATVLDTARSYGLDDADAGHNERLIGRALREHGGSSVRVVTKCGMRRALGAGARGGFRPDGRASTIEADASASVEALGGVPIDVLLLHAPDPRVSLSTSVRALSRVRERGLAKSIGLANVSRTQLLEALAIAPITTVELALGAYDDDAARGGILRVCAEHGIEVLAYSAFGGPARAARLAKDGVLRAIAGRHGASPHEVMLAYLLALHPAIIPIVGARRPETARSALSAMRLSLDADTLERLDARFPGLSVVRRPPARAPDDARAEVVVIMGITGAGKSRAAKTWEERGYERLNRDTLGGTLRGIAKRLDERLAAGATRLVLDNTYTSRATRTDVLAVAARHGARVVCAFLETPLHEAQVNVVLRMLERHGEILGPDAMARVARTDPGLVTPQVQFRMARELERPSLDEGFARIDVLPFERVPRAGGEGAMVALDAIAHEAASGLELRPDARTVLERLPEGAPCLVFAWRPAVTEAWTLRARELTERLSRSTGRIVELGLCAHDAGPPVCWCRPPLPGLWLSFAIRHGVDPARGVVIGAGAAPATMARSLGLRLGLE